MFANNAGRSRQTEIWRGIVILAGNVCAREEIRDHWEDRREGGEIGARHSLLARQHSDLSIDFHDRSRTDESERTQRTNERGTKGERGVRSPQGFPPWRATNLKRQIARAIYMFQGCRGENAAREVFRHDAKTSVDGCSFTYRYATPTSPLTPPVELFADLVNTESVGDNDNLDNTIMINNVK